MRQITAILALIVSFLVWPPFSSAMITSRPVAPVGSNGAEPLRAAMMVERYVWPGQPITLVLDHGFFLAGELITVVRSDTSSVVSTISAPAGRNWVTFNAPSAALPTGWLRYDLWVGTSAEPYRGPSTPVWVWPATEPRANTTFYSEQLREVETCDGTNCTTSTESFAEYVYGGRIRITLNGGDVWTGDPQGVAYLTWQGESNDIVGKSLALSYIKDQSASWCMPQLWLDRQTVGSRATWVRCAEYSSSFQTLSINVTPYGFGSVDLYPKQILPGGTHAIVTRYLPYTPGGGFARYLEGRRQEWQNQHATSASPESLRQIMSLTGEIYWSALAASDHDTVARIPGLAWYGITMSTAIASHNWDGSVGMHVASVLDGWWGTDWWKRYLVRSGWMTSRFEGEIIESAFGRRGLSMVHVFDDAKLRGIELVKINPYAPLPDLSAHDPSHVQLVQDMVQAGYTVVVPRVPTTLDDWTGTGIYELDAATGAAGTWLIGRHGGTSGWPTNGGISGFRGLDFAHVPPAFVPAVDSLDLSPSINLGGLLDAFGDTADGIFNLSELDDITGVDVACGPICAGIKLGQRAAPFVQQARDFLARQWGFVHQGFEKFRQFKDAFGNAGPDHQLHHIVKQTPENIQNFGAAIHHPGNVIRLETPIHFRINAFYMRPQPRITGDQFETLNSWILRQSFEVQHNVGVQVLREHGVTWP